MAYLGDIIRTLKNGMESINEANILRVMRQKDSSIRDGDERVLVGQEMLGGKEVSVSGKMKILLIKIADGTVGVEYVRKNMDLLREINSDKQNLSKAVTDNIMSMTSCEDVVGALLGKKVNGLATEIPSVSDEERKSRDGLEHFYERVRDACHKVFKKDGYRVLLDKLDACHYIEKIYDRNHVVIAKVTSHEGAVGVGAFGASWCTCVAGANSKNMYDHYAKDDLKIVFVDRDNDYNSIWQCSENKYSWCMNAGNNSSKNNMIAAIAEASGGDNAVRDIIDAIDNDILSKWLDEEFGIKAKGIKTDIEYDRKEVDGYCIVTRKRMVNGRSLAKMYNICKVGFREISEAEFLLPEWFDYVGSPRNGFVRVGNDERRNLFDMNKKEFVLPDWVDNVYSPKDGFVRVENDERWNLFDMNKKEFVFQEWLHDVHYFVDGFVGIQKDGKWNLFDLKTNKFVLPEWFDYVGYSGDGFVRVQEGWDSNLFDLRTNELVLPEWFEYVEDPKDGFIKVRKDRKLNLFDIRTEKFVLSEWVDFVDYPEDGSVLVKKSGKWQKIELSTPGKTESRRRRCAVRICECCGRKIR